MKAYRYSIFFVCLASLFWGTSIAEEGMYPLSEIHKLNLREAGLQIDSVELFNPEGISLLDGICKVGGCSGSFVSTDGLILTNHHCAYDAIQNASDEGHDYIQDGFLARNRAEEIAAPGYTVRITESYRDVSADVLGAVDAQMSLAERTNAIEKKMKAIITEIERKNPGKRAEVSEMFIGKSYVLFLYTYLKDIRLVYAPPRSIGNFGGETDNWMWPRHTGDFSFMRAYVAADGTPADYSADNVPYRPRKVIKVAPDGVDEEDFVFILGYPGRTYRHYTSQYLDFEEKVRMPYVVDLYQWQIDTMEKLGEGDRAVALKHLSRIKGLANTMKNYRGKILGLQRLQLVERKRNEEKALQQFIDADAKRRALNATLLEEIGAVYAEMEANSDRELLLTYLRRSSILLNCAYTVYEAAIERAKGDIERESAYMDRNFQKTKDDLLLTLDDYYEATDKVLLKEMLLRAARLPHWVSIGAVNDIVGNEEPERAIDDFIEKTFITSRLSDKDVVSEAFKKTAPELLAMRDPMLSLAEALYPTYQEKKEVDDTRKGALDQLYARLIDVKKEFLSRDFIPDANGTLRLTYGHIRGYRPRDAVYYTPLTTVDGVVEKSTGEEPFDTPAALLALVQRRNFGRFAHEALGSVPVAMLYNMDTTGGNSGSAVLNARGELVGINFDRAFEATINDFAWSEDYSRSIAVDIRYVLWVTQKFGRADYLLKEMGIL